MGANRRRRDEEIDVVLGLDAGADDYLAKPFRLAEFMARCMRTCGAARWAQRTQSCSASAISPLRAKDFDLLARLACAGQAAVSRTDLMSDVWDENWFGSTKTLDVHVACR